MKKYTYEYVFNYFKEQGCELLEKEYIDSKTKMKYKCSCGTITSMKFSHFNKGHRCNNCGIKNSYLKQCFTYEYVKNYFEYHKCELLENKYINARTKMNYICECGYKSTIVFDKFCNGQRCIKCRNEKLSIKNSKFIGENTSNWNPNREEVSMKRRIRVNVKYNWIIKNMKDDPLYNDYIINKYKYNIDHIIPLGIFSKLIVNYNLNPDKIRKIINKRNNLQILTKHENSSKRSKGCLFQACQYLMLNGIKLI